MTFPSDSQALLDATAQAILVVDHKGTVLVCNRAAEHLFGYAAREVIGDNIDRLMMGGTGSLNAQYLQRFVDTRSQHILERGHEVEALRKDGSVIPVLVSLGAVEGAEPPRFVALIQDLASRLRAEEDTHRLQGRLTHVSRLATVGEMSAGIAHELNQPLAAVANYAQACKRFLALPDPDLQEICEALEEITVQAVRAGDIIRRLRSLARNDEMQREPTNVNELLEELSELIHLDAKTQQVNYRLEIADGLPAVNVDRAQLQLVILNLVRNAVDALSDYPVAPREITIRTRRMPPGDVEIAVCDNGPGVSASIKSRLFDPFCSTKLHGTGLGLATSRSILNSHQGSLEYHANSPTGSCFTMRLPVGQER
jgi:two-component system, LuxR family, sensor kinase FixL